MYTHKYVYIYIYIYPRDQNFSDGIGWGGVGWGGVGGINVHEHVRTCVMLLLHMYTGWTLRCKIFSCTSTHAGRYVVRSSLAHVHTLDATL